MAAADVRKLGLVGRVKGAVGQLLQLGVKSRKRLDQWWVQAVAASARRNRVPNATSLRVLGARVASRDAQATVCLRPLS